MCFYYTWCWGNVSVFSKYFRWKVNLPCLLISKVTCVCLRIDFSAHVLLLKIIIFYGRIFTRTVSFFSVYSEVAHLIVNWHFIVCSECLLSLECSVLLYCVPSKSKFWLGNEKTWEEIAKCLEQHTCCFL